MAAWLTAALPFTRRPGPMARTNHGMAASAKYTGSTTLTAGTAAGVAGWEDGGHGRAGSPGRRHARLLAMATCLWHNTDIGALRKRSLIAYDR